MKKREKKGPTLGLIQLGGQSSRRPNALSYEQLGRCAVFQLSKVDVAVKKRGTCNHLEYTVEGNNSSDTQKGQLKRKFVASRSDCEHEDREFISDSGASLHMRSKNELTSGEKIPSEDRKNPLSSRPPRERHSRWKQMTVYVHGMDVFVTAMLLNGSPAVLPLGISCEEICYAYEWRREVSINGERWKSDTVQV